MVHCDSRWNYRASTRGPPVRRVSDGAEIVGVAHHRQETIIAATRRLAMLQG
jgi:hypothetical protein